MRVGQVPWAQAPVWAPTAAAARRKVRRCIGGSPFRGRGAARPADAALYVAGASNCIMRLSACNNRFPERTRMPRVLTLAAAQTGSVEDGRRRTITEAA